MNESILGRFFEKNVDKNQVSTSSRIEPNLDSTIENRDDDTALRSTDDAEKAMQIQDSLISQRVALHSYLLDHVNLGFLDTMTSEELADEVKPIVREYVRQKEFPLSAGELDVLIEDTANEMLGLGPLEPLLKDDTIADILVNSHRQVFIERFGVLHLTDVRFKDEDHLLRIVTKIVSAVGRRVDESSPLVDARLPDGSRVNVAVRPVTIDGPMVSIRKFSKRPYTLERLVEGDSMAEAMRVLLVAAVKGRKSIIISGGTGSGKTTMLNALSSQISNDERLITIEDAAELQLQQIHVCRLETKPPSLDGENEIKQRELLKNALRMRPDRIIVGEVLSLIHI